MKRHKAWQIGLALAALALEVQADSPRWAPGLEISDARPGKVRVTTENRAKRPGVVVVETAPAIEGPWTVAFEVKAGTRQSRVVAVDESARFFRARFNKVPGGK
jgi:hypothetical protein